METASCWSMSSLNLKKFKKVFMNRSFLLILIILHVLQANCSPVHKTCHEGRQVSQSLPISQALPVLPHPSPGHARQPPSGNVDNLVTSNVPNVKIEVQSLSFTPQMQQWDSGTWCFLSMALHSGKTHSSEFSQFSLPQSGLKGTQSLLANLHSISHF